VSGERASERDVEERTHGRDVRRDVGAHTCVDEPAVVQDVAGEEVTRVGVVQVDRAGRVARQVEDAEPSVAEVDDIAVGQS